MHRIDQDGHVGNMFDEGDPTVPRLPTMVGADILNAFQEEIANVIENAGIALVKGTNTQLRDAVVNILTNQSIDGIKTWIGRQIVNVANALPALSIAQTGAGSAMYASSMDGTNPTLDLANGGNGPVSAQVSSTTQPVAACRNNGTGPALQLQSADGHWPLQLVPVTTLPTTNPAGGSLSAADDGAVVYMGGAYNKLYCYENSTGWNALW